MKGKNRYVYAGKNEEGIIKKTAVFVKVLNRNFFKTVVYVSMVAVIVYLPNKNIKVSCMRMGSYK